MGRKNQIDTLPLVSLMGAYSHRRSYCKLGKPHSISSSLPQPANTCGKAITPTQKDDSDFPNLAKEKVPRGSSDNTRDS